MRNTRQNSPTHPSERSLILSRHEANSIGGWAATYTLMGGAQPPQKKYTHIHIAMARQYVRWTGLAGRNSQTPFHEVLFVCGIPACENSWSGSNLVAQPSMANSAAAPARSPPFACGEFLFRSITLSPLANRAYYRRASSSFMANPVCKINNFFKVVFKQV
jgi:hypothetical protein